VDIPKNSSEFVIAAVFVLNETMAGIGQIIE
jgi:hypothetical protein